MASNSNDDKLRDTLKKHEFDEEAAKKLESTANKNIQNIFDKSRSENDTGVTQIGEVAEDLEVSEEVGEIVIDMSESTATSVNADSDQDEDDEIDLDEDIGAEFQELRPSSPNDDDDEIDDDILDFSDGDDEVDLSDLEEEKESSVGSDMLNFSAQESDASVEVADEDDEDTEEQDATNLIDALVSAQNVENEFADDSEEDLSLDDIFEGEGNDELAPTMVDINQQAILNKIDDSAELSEFDDDSDDVVQNLLNETKVEEEGGNEESLEERFESEIVKQDEPSFSAMPGVMDSLQNSKDSDFAQDSEEGIDDELSEHKEFGFSTEGVDSGELEATKIDATSKVHDQNDDNGVTLAQSPVGVIDDDEATRVTSYNEVFADSKPAAEANQDQDVEDEDATRILGANEQETLIQQPPVVDEEDSSEDEVGSEEQVTSEKKEIPSYSESEMLKHQSTIRMLRDDRQGLLDEIDSLKEKNSITSKENLNLKAELDELHIELTIIRKRHEEDLSELRYNLNYSEDKKKMLEEKLKKNQVELSSMGDRVRVDLDKLRRKEKDLENQLELVQMDTANQVQNRESKILELKRKIDALEFNMENTVLKEQKAREDKKKLEERLRSIMKTLRGSIRLLEEDINIDEELFKPSSDM